jgi:hypothetical protein
MTATELLAGLPHLRVDLLSRSPIDDDAEETVERALRVLSALERMGEQPPDKHKNDAVLTRRFGCCDGVDTPGHLCPDTVGECEWDEPEQAREGCRVGWWWAVWQGGEGPGYYPTAAEALAAWSAMMEVS